MRVAERDGVALPAECDVPPDDYNDEYACKHRVSLTTIGGPTVLNAAAAFSPDTTTEEIATDGGGSGSEIDTCPNGYFA